MTMLTSLEINSNAWGSPRAASVRALHETKVTSTNESMIRSYHRSLSEAETVHISEGLNGSCVWLVTLTTKFKVWDTQAGGLDIHVLPKFQVPHPLYSSFMEDPVPRRINPRRMLPPNDLRIIRRIFPLATGIRILIAGFAIVLFSTKGDLEKSLAARTPNELGLLRLGHAVVSYNATSYPVEHGYPVAEYPSCYDSLGCLGLRLEFPSGQNVITTTTHAFVRLAKPKGPFILRLSDWYVRVRRALANFSPLKINYEVPAVGGVRENLENTPIGKTVWLAGTDQKVCENI
jgi:hypothetical protein